MVDGLIAFTGDEQIIDVAKHNHPLIPKDCSCKQARFRLTGLEVTELLQQLRKVADHV